VLDGKVCDVDKVEETVVLVEEVVLLVVVDVVVVVVVVVDEVEAVVVVPVLVRVSPVLQGKYTLIVISNSPVLLENSP